jgi:hypothetical protein
MHESKYLWFYNFIMYTPVLLIIMIIVVMPRYNWNIVEGGIKHYNPIPKGEKIFDIWYLILKA